MGYKISLWIASILHNSSLSILKSKAFKLSSNCSIFLAPIIVEAIKSKCLEYEIAKVTGASTATISRVNRSLNYGNDGYDLVLGRLDK